MAHAGARLGQRLAWMVTEIIPKRGKGEVNLVLEREELESDGKEKIKSVIFQDLHRPFLLSKMNKIQLCHIYRF